MEKTYQKKLKVSGGEKKINPASVRLKFLQNIFLAFPIANTNNRIIFTNTFPLIICNNKIFKTFL
jgi:hypothetical protein